MQKRPLHLSERPLAIPVPRLAQFAEGWLLDGEIRRHSQQTLAMRRLLVRKLLWFLEDRKSTECGVLELRQFFAYITNGHSSEGGRWNNPTRTRQVRPKTVKTYHNHLRPFFHWLIQEGIIEVSPMDVIAAPVCRTDQIQPFDERQVTALLHAAKKTLHPKRDYAIVCFLLDTGLRASELCDLRMSTMDMSARKCIVLGKGNKHRAAFFGQQTSKALWHYLKEEDREPHSAVFRSDRGSRAGDPLTRSGLLQLIERLGNVAKIEAVRCSPHTFRHTFAVTFLRNGGNVFTLQQILGHTNLSMTNRYVAVSQGDLEKQHRQFSPVDRLGGR